MNNKLSAARIGGKGTPRRKIKKATHSNPNDDKKLGVALKKLNVQPVGGIDQVNLFLSNGKVIHFAMPKVSACISSNTFVIAGHSAEKEILELVPDILTQLGPDSIQSLQKLAEAYKNEESSKGDDEIPELVGNFDQVN